MSLGTAVRRKIRSPQTTGDADPRPGISTFHFTFFVSLHSTGGSARSEAPVAKGPRHCGQNACPGASEACVGATTARHDESASTLAWRMVNCIASLDGRSIALTAGDNRENLVDDVLNRHPRRIDADRVVCAHERGCGTRPVASVAFLECGRDVLQPGARPAGGMSRIQRAPARALFRRC